MPIRIRTAELPGGIRLPYAEHGDPAGIPVLMLHGWSDSWRSFEGVMPHLPTSTRALALTLRGHADTSGPDSHTISDMSADVAAFLDAVGVESAVIAGHSMGSIVAERVALDHPARVAGLVLMGARPTFERPNMEELYAAVAELTDPVDPVFIREFQESTVTRPVAPGLIDMAVAESRKLTAGVWRELMDGVLRVDFSAELPSIAAPTLVIAAEGDEIAPLGDAGTLAAIIPGARLAIYDDAGHAMHWEEPARVAGDIAAFAREAAPAGAQPARRARPRAVGAVNAR
jgi:non-heme chloroperoxidase